MTGLAGWVLRAALCCLIAVTACPLAGRGAAAAGPVADPGIVNRGAIEVETSGRRDGSARFVEDIASVVEDGTTRRVVPIVGRGPLQNLADLRYLRGIDLSIVQADALDYAREQRYLPGIETTIPYVTKLYNAEFHLLARNEIQSFADLLGQVVNVGPPGSGTALTAGRLFDLLKLTVTVANDSEELALQKLRSGQIAALAFVAPKPLPFFRMLQASEGYRLLSIPLTKAVTGAYAPTRFTAADYPELVAPAEPVDSIAVGNVLMAADLHLMPERTRSLAGFIEAFFTGFQTLLGPGHQPKWHEVNIAADVPGWRRHPAAEQWLRRNLQVAAPNPDALKGLFSQFIDERRLASGGGPMSSEDKDALFQQFRSWQRGQAR